MGVFSGRKKLARKAENNLQEDGMSLTLTDYNIDSVKIGFGLLYIKDKLYIPYQEYWACNGHQVNFPGASQLLRLHR